jgi:hypothetical protein
MSSKPAMHTFAAATSLFDSHAIRQCPPSLLAQVALASRNFRSVFVRSLCIVGVRDLRSAGVRAGCRAGVLARARNYHAPRSEGSAFALSDLSPPSKMGAPGASHLGAWETTNPHHPPHLIN